MVENEERKKTKGKDLKMGGGKNGVCGGRPSFERHWKWETIITGGSHCRSEICLAVILKETK
jgi:hypothetical protein